MNNFWIFVLGAIGGYLIIGLIAVYIDMCFSKDPCVEKNAETGEVEVNDFVYFLLSLWPIVLVITVAVYVCEFIGKLLTMFFKFLIKLKL